MLMFAGNVLSQIGLLTPSPFSFLQFTPVFAEHTWIGTHKDFNYIPSGGARGLCPAIFNIDGRQTIGWT